MCDAMSPSSVARFATLHAVFLMERVHHQIPTISRFMNEKRENRGKPSSEHKRKRHIAGKTRYHPQSTEALPHIRVYEIRRITSKTV